MGAYMKKREWKNETKKIMNEWMHAVVPECTNERMNEWMEWNEWNEMKRNETKKGMIGSEWKEINDLRWISLNEWTAMNKLKWMNWNEGKEMNELKWRNWHEWLEVNKMK